MQNASYEVLFPTKQLSTRSPSVTTIIVGLRRANGVWDPTSKAVRLENMVEQHELVKRATETSWRTPVQYFKGILAFPRF